MSTNKPDPSYEVVIDRDVRIPTADALVTLAADIHRPVTAGPVPALVTLTPYRRDFIAGASHEGPARRFAERGYACLLVDIQGTGSSDGLMRPFNDPGEGDDAVSAIEWAAAQPWCTGDVGMWGLSYGGYSTMRAASRRPPHLRAIIPMMGPIDVERDAVHPDGARGDLHTLVRRGGSNLLLQLLPPLGDHTSPAEQQRWRRRLEESEPYFLDLARHQLGDPHLRSRAIDAGSIRTPALCVGGWRDLYCDATVRAYQQLQGPKKLLMGPWMHTLPQNSPVEPIDFPAIALRWWDHWLRGVDTGMLAEPAVTLYTLGEKPGWRSYGSWPPAAGDLVLSTGAGTTLATPHGTGPSSAIAEYQPDPAIGTSTGLWRIGAGGFGLPLDQHDDDLRAVSATSEPLAAGLLIAGRPEVAVRLPATATGDVRRLVVRLTEVDPHGRATLVTAGVLCPEEPSRTHRVLLFPTAYRVPAGHRVRVALSDADFPRLRPLPDPSALAIAGIELSTPTVPDDAGAAADIPVTGATSTKPGGRWLITRDPVQDGVNVTIGSTSQGRTPGQGHPFEKHDETRATVRRDAPHAATITGSYHAIVHMNTGETIRATASIRSTLSTLWVHGAVTIDDATMFSRNWVAELGPGATAVHVVDAPPTAGHPYEQPPTGPAADDFTSLLTG